RATRPPPRSTAPRSTCSPRPAPSPSPRRSRSGSPTRSGGGTRGTREVRHPIRSGDVTGTPPSGDEDRTEVRQGLGQGVVHVGVGHAHGQPSPSGELAVATLVTSRLPPTVVPERVIDLDRESPLRPRQVDLDGLPVDLHPQV